MLHTPLAAAPDQEIVYREVSRYTYRMLRQRIGQLAGGLAELGVKSGDGAISKWAVPDIRFVDSLEKTSVGKLDKKVLRQQYG